jgi:hypothetical protein
MGPCGFHFFGFLTKHLVGKEFAADGKVKQGVTPWLQAHNTDHFYVRTQAVLPWRFKCLNISSGSVEVWCVTSATNLSCACRYQNKVIGIRV